MNRLVAIGFKNAGEWRLEKGALSFVLFSHADTPNILYAFVHEQKVMYIGKTTKPLKTRMYWYQKPGATQSTNIKNHNNIKRILLDDGKVDIFILSDSGLLNHGGFHLNLAAGLEDSLIAALSPPWNGFSTVLKKDELIVQEEKSKKLESKSHYIKPARTMKQVDFDFRLAPTYFGQGFFNVSVKFEEYFGDDKDIITIFLPKIGELVKGHINRSVNINKTPRIMGGVVLKNWFQAHCQLNGNVHVCILSPNSIAISPKR